MRERSKRERESEIVIESRISEHVSWEDRIPTIRTVQHAYLQPSKREVLQDQMTRIGTMRYIRRLAAASCQRTFFELDDLIELYL